MIAHGVKPIGTRKGSRNGGTCAYGRALQAATKLAAACDTRLIALRAVRSLWHRCCGTRLWALPKPTKGFHPLETLTRDFIP